MKRVTALAAVSATLALATGSAEAAPTSCGTMPINGADLPVLVTRGSVGCGVARKALRQFFPLTGRGRQSFRLAGRSWFCTDAHGRKLLRGEVAHCSSNRIYVALRQPRS
jgi:hypothetical protein